jgi:hypothetical protein
MSAGKKFEISNFTFPFRKSIKSDYENPNISRFLLSYRKWDDSRFFKFLYRGLKIDFFTPSRILQFSPQFFDGFEAWNISYNREFFFCTKPALFYYFLATFVNERAIKILANLG